MPNVITMGKRKEIVKKIKKKKKVFKQGVCFLHFHNYYLHHHINNKKPKISLSLRCHHYYNHYSRYVFLIFSVVPPSHPCRCCIMSLLHLITDKGMTITIEGDSIDSELILF